MTTPDTDTHITHAAAMDALRLWLRARDDQAEPREREAAARKVLDAFFEETGERELTDGESNRGCRLQARRGTPSYDLVNMRERDPQLFERLFALGALVVNHRIAEAQEQAGQVAGVAAFRMPGGISDALVEVKPS